MPVSPARKVSVRLTVSYTGYVGQSQLLEALYQRGLQGEELERYLWEQPGMLMYWGRLLPAPWQTEAWRGRVGIGNEL